MICAPNLIKKFRRIMIAMITVGILLTACGSRGEEKAEQESQPEEQNELQTETQSDVQVEFQIEFQPEPELKMNNDNWAQAYLSVITELQENRDLDGIDFGLIYVNDDDIPELVFGPEGYWVSLYTWQDGQVYTVMDKESYGTWGRIYTYVPSQNVIKEWSYYYFDYDDDGFTRRGYDDFYQMAETTYELEYIYGLIVEDIIKYEVDEMEASTLYYVEPDWTEREITKEEYVAYDLVREEEDVWLSGDLSADEITNKLVKTGQLLSNNEGEKEITLSDITWDDYYSGSYETWLHFSFSNGAEIDKELQYSPSIVEKVDYVDITGDGMDEVLIYRYFANTATEYTLINFFLVEENGVTEISPELELEELANDVWNVIEADFSEEKYDMPVFTMESYEKENMLVYLDKRVLVGYQGGGWQILEWFDCPEPGFE
ncbi:MAG: hypothetical protein HDQ99_20745 [Lachnospiraceae bacterium]|nr:hypothetical protein [Lachnospiraceae bacterium]